jgi:ribonucleotide reductase alpha subunit
VLGARKAVDPSQILHSDHEGPLRRRADGRGAQVRSVLAARALIEKDPAYGFVTARLLLDTHPLRSARRVGDAGQMGERYAEYFPQFIKSGIDAGLLDHASAVRPATPRPGPACRPRLQFGYLGLQTLYDRYFLHIEGSASSCRRRSSCAWRWAWR